MEKPDQPDRYAVVGHPIGHSRSPVIHTLFARQTGQNMSYEKLDAAPREFLDRVQRFGRTGGKGLNITTPHKAEAARMADELSERARMAGTANTLTFQSDGKLSADNTDGVGLVRDLRHNLGISLEDQRVLILGAGGATRGVIGPLLKERLASTTVANRTEEKATHLAEYFSVHGAIIPCSFEALEGQGFDIAINATSAGLKGEAPPFPASCISAGTLCYDMSYALQPTPFVVWAQKCGATRTVQGWGMLVEQAAESFYIWRGVRPDTDAILRQLR